MFLDDAVIFGLVTVAMMIAFMGGWIAFIVRDSRKKRH
ncbi:cytochrome c oxidase subunit CcoM [Halomonas sp.]|nr:cytochrome c oxidase subunit CcoM [Halomonas sp.]